MVSNALKKYASYENLFEKSNSVMLIIDPETGIINDANQAAKKFYQYSKTEMRGMNISDINTLSPKEIQKEMHDAKLQNRSYYNFQHRLKNGQIKSVEVYTSPIDVDGQKELYSIIHDTSEKKKVINALKESEATIRTMINATNSMVYLFDMKGKIINLNRPGALLFDKTPEEMIGTNFKLFFDQNDFSRLTLTVKKVIQTLQPVSYQKNRKDRYYDVNLYPVFNKRKRVDKICVFVYDITELKKTEKVFAAIETAGGICHEMNQPLQIILGNLELLKLNIPADDPNIHYIDVILAQTEKLGVITKKLTHITRYETKEYIKGTIFDIDKSSGIK